MAQDQLGTGTDECMSGTWESAGAIQRSQAYNNMLFFFGGMESEDHVGCRTTLLDYRGAGDQDAFWTPDYSNRPNRCKLVNYEQRYSVYNEDDYKRCVCENWGDGE